MSLTLQIRMPHRITSDGVTFYPLVEDERTCLAQFEAELERIVLAHSGERQDEAQALRATMHRLRQRVDDLERFVSILKALLAKDVSVQEFVRRVHEVIGRGS